MLLRDAHLFPPFLFGGIAGLRLGGLFRRRRAANAHRGSRNCLQSLFTNRSTATRTSAIRVGPYSCQSFINLVNFVGNVLRKTGRDIVGDRVEALVRIIPRVAIRGLIPQFVNFCIQFRKQFHAARAEVFCSLYKEVFHC